MQATQRLDVVVNVLKHVDQYGNVERRINELINMHDVDVLGVGVPVLQQGDGPFGQFGGSDVAVARQRAGERAVAGTHLQDPPVQVRRHQRHDPVGVVRGG